MTQTRIWNYGDTFTSFRGTTVMGELHPPGVFSGYDISITDSNKISVSPGFLLLPTGILIGEDVPLEFIIDPIPSAVTTYTLTCRHTDADIIGGQAALYALEAGELVPSAIPDGIPLAYIYYPGGAVPLEDYFIVPVRKVLDAPASALTVSPESLLAPFTPKWLVDTLGSDVTITDTYASPSAYVNVSTGGAGVATPGFSSTTVAIPMVARSLRPRSIIVRPRITSINSSIVVSVLDTDGNPVLLTGAPPATPTEYPISGTIPVFSDSTVSLDASSGVFTEGDLYTLVLEFRAPQSQAVDLQSLTVTYDPLP